MAANALIKRHNHCNLCTTKLTTLAATPSNAVGILRSQRPLPVADLARAMIAATVQAAGQPENIRRVLAPQDIHQLLAQQP